MSKKSTPLANINHSYYCKTCWKFANVVMSCHEKPPLSSEMECPHCESLGMTYKGGTDCRVTITGNCGYESFEKGSRRNIKELGKDRYNQMCEEDPVVKHKKASAEQGKKMWWRKNLKDPSKPLPLDKIKNIQKYVDTGETD